MSGIIASVSDSAKLGYYRIYAQAPGSEQKIDITFFRGAPISIGSLTHSDPFGDKSASLSVKNVTIYDTLGSGDLTWLAAWTKIDIVWEPDPDLDSETTKLIGDWSWEGNIASWSFSQTSTEGSINIECIGALYILDNMLAMPFYPSRPIPYETLIDRLFKRATSYNYGLGNLVIDYDAKECLTYHAANYKFGTQNPAFLSEGQLWSGFANKSTGNKQKALTGFVTTLLSSMYSTTGKQWTLMNKKGRDAVLKVRKYRDDSYIKNNPGDYDILYIDAITPGVTLSLNQDHTNTANVIYGTGTTSDGRKFTSPNGNSTYTPKIPNTSYGYLYHEQNSQPFAVQKAVQDANDLSHKKTVRKEQHVDFQANVNAYQAVSVANRQLDIIKDPGYSGSIVMSVDPVTGNNFVFPRYLIEAGKTIIVYFGSTDKYVTFNISEVQLNMETGEVSLTVDSKNKDLITVEEVRARRNDALNLVRRLDVKSGSLDVPQADYLRPWQGSHSGKMPKTIQSLELFDKIDSSEKGFPWTDVTTKYPPSSNPEMYVKIGPTNATNPSKNWAEAVKVLLSAKGNIGTTQIAAYRSDGTIFPVEFHVSFYLNNGVKVADMPGINFRQQTFDRQIKQQLSWVPNQSPGKTDGWVQVTFKKPHGLQISGVNSGWKIGRGTLTGDWVPPAGGSTAIVNGVNTILYYKAAKPTSGTKYSTGTMTLTKNTFPRQRASLGKSSTGIVANYSQYSIIWDSTISKYRVTILIGQDSAIPLEAKIKDAKKIASITNDSMYGNSNVNITVTGATTNPSINGSFTTTVSGQKGTIEYQLTATDVITGTYNENISVEIDISAQVRTQSDLGNYNEGKYPFFEWAFQDAFDDGTSFAYTTTETAQNKPTDGSGFLMGWGNYWQPAGYGAGLASEGSPKVGTLIDEQGWSYDTVEWNAGFVGDGQTGTLADTPSTTQYFNGNNLGFVYAMIYCDDQGPDDVYFLGRMYPAGEGN